MRVRRNMVRFKATARCIYCILRQVIEAAEYATDDPALRFQAVKEVIYYFNNHDLIEESHVGFSRDVHAIVRRVTKTHDPYRRLKKLSNETAQTILRETDLYDGSFESAVRLAAIGNIIDYGIASQGVDPHTLFHKVRKDAPDPKKVEDLKRLISQGHKVLYLCDNAGEIVFDAQLIKHIKRLGLQITTVVRKYPVLNDATWEDAEEAGIPASSNVITTGTDTAGILLEESSQEFQKEFKESDLVISKGQGNLESLLDIEEKPTTAYILKVKCKTMADFLHSQVGKTEIIIQKNGLE